MGLPAHLEHAYRQSRYTVAGLELTIGRRSLGLDGLLQGMRARDGVLITAWNPASRRRPRGWNDRMMAALRGRLNDGAALPAHGAGPGWSEDHLLVAGDRRRLMVLARVFGQFAILGLRRGQPVRLLALL